MLLKLGLLRENRRKAQVSLSILSHFRGSFRALRGGRFARQGRRKSHVLGVSKTIFSIAFYRIFDGRCGGTGSFEGPA